MNRTRSIAVLVSALTSVALVASAGASSAAPAAGPPGTTSTSVNDARKTDRVPTPRPDWFDCSSVFAAGDECASVDLPLDYDEPNGATTSVAVLRLKATDQKHKIGTLFLNPGGPGGSGVQFAAMAGYFLGADVLARFDVVGFDPRGTNFSDGVKCWKNVGTQSADLAGAQVAFPFTSAEKTAYIKSSKAFGKACSTVGKPLSGSMSTAEVARDMDVLRRMVGDKQLTYLGFSYGTYLGNVYANMFPGRVRAVAIDGVLDPIGWAGTQNGTTVPQTARIKSGEGAALALKEILARCGTAGAKYCGFAANGNPKQSYAKIVSSLKAAPLVIGDPESGEEFTLTYATLVSVLLSDMYDPNGAAMVDSDLSYVHDLFEPPAKPKSAAAKDQAAARTAIVDKLRAVATAAARAEATKAQQRASLGFAFPYDNSAEAFQSVLCTDGRNPASADGWRAYADRAERSAPDFGRLWTWASAPCASNTWTVHDEDAYSGTFTHATSNPVLVVGNYWDPATNYKGAVAAAALLPNSYLLSSDSWGHTAYGTSECVTEAVDRYLLTRKTPAKGTRCVGDVQPFTTPLEPSDGAKTRTLRPSGLPPVVPPLPGAVPRS